MRLQQRVLNHGDGHGDGHDLVLDWCSNVAKETTELQDHDRMNPFKVRDSSSR